MKTKSEFRNKRRNFILFVTLIATLIYSSETLQGQNPVYSYAKKMGGTSVEVSNCITPNGTGGDLTTGYFKGTCDFNPGGRAANLTSAGGSDIFIADLGYTGNYRWAKKIGGTGDDGGNSIVRDAYGNLYVAGYFSGTVDFDPGVGVQNLTSNGGTDIFIAKYDTSGNYLFAYKIGGPGNDQATSITLDWGNKLYITGFFSSINVDFDPGLNYYPLPYVGGKDIFMLCLDVSLQPNYGNFVWAKSVGSSGDDEGLSIYVNRNVVLSISGFFSGTCDFDPGAGTTNLSSAGGTDIFISRMDYGGNFRWAKRVGGTSNDTAFSVSADINNNAYLTGNFSGTNINFDPGAGTANLSSAGGSDIFIWKLDNSGNYVWAKEIGGTTFDSGHSLSLDANSYLYATGVFSGSNVDFDPGAGTASISSMGSSDIFICKLDTAGNYNWAGGIGSISCDVGNSLIIDGGNNLFATGCFTGTVDFDPGSGTSNLVAAGSCDIFVTKCNQTPTQLIGQNCTPPTPTEFRPNNGPYTVVNNPLKKEGYQLIFHDEFDSTGIRTNTENPSVQHQNSLWVEKSQRDGATTSPVYYKSEVEGNSTQPSYSFHVSSTSDYLNNCALSMNVNHETLGNGTYTSGWLESIRSFKYGYFEIRAKLPTQQATWSTWWLFTSEPGADDEIDNYEIVKDHNSVYNDQYNYHYLNHGYPTEALAFWGPSPVTNGSNYYDLITGIDFSAQYHTYGLEWSPGRIDYYLDNKLVRSIINDCNVSETMMHMITALNITNSENPNPASFPGSYLIDYIRVYKKIWVENYGTVAGGYTYEHPRMMADLDGSGSDDIVAFGGAGVYVSLAIVTGGNFSYQAPSLWTANFGYDQGWTTEAYVRTTADVTGDGRADIVAFGRAGVYICKSNGTSLDAPSLWIANYGYEAGAGGWRVEYHPRMMADVNGDGKADVVGFGGAGVYVSLSNGTSFGAPSLWTANYGYDASAGSWRVDTDVRQMADVNGDGKADVVGFNASGTWVALSTGTSFSTPVNGAPYFANSTDISLLLTPRTMADVNADGKADIVGFLKDGVYVALSNGTATFNPQSRWINHFGWGSQAGTWTVADHPRMMADLNGDGMADIVGFKGIGVYVSFSTATGFSDTIQWTDFYGSDVNGGSFTVAKNPRMTAEVNGDCRKDIVAFGDSGVFVTLSPKCNPYLFRIANPSNGIAAQSNDNSKNPISGNDLNIFPNPGAGLFTVSLPEGDIKFVSVFDLTGQIVFEMVTSEKKINIDISTQQKGMYFVKCVIDGNTHVVKYLNL